MDASSSPLFELVIAGSYEAGLEVYAALSQRSPYDDRWAGVCLYNLRRMLDAKEMLLRARGRGCLAAGIELATVHRQLGEDERGTEILGELEASALTPFDRALYEREWGVVHRTAGDLASAALSLERAWALAAGAPRGDALLPGVALALGLVQAARGFDARAVHHFGRALESAVPARRSHLLVSRASALTHLGRFEEAERDLLDADAGLAHSSLAAPLVRYYAAALERARGRRARAAELFVAAATLAREAEESEIECYAELGACAVETGRDRLDRARAHLARARALAAGERAQANVGLRDGALRARAGDPGCLLALEAALASFAALGLGRESGWARLHLAEACLVANDLAAASAHLLAAADALHALGGGASLAAELRDLPRVQDHLDALPDGAHARTLLDAWMALDGPLPLKLDLRTVGAPGLAADGKPVHLNAGLARTVETLAFLLLHPGSSLEQVQAAIFPDTSPARAKSHFHLVRAELQRAAPGLSIPYDPGTRSYSVCHDGVRLRWDALELRRVLADGGEDGLERALDLYRGPFLPLADGEWARAERDDLEWTMVKVGLRTIEDFFERGEYAKCLYLAGRLLEVAPLNDALNGYLVRATTEVEGLVAARRELERVRERYQGDVGEVPPSVLGLERTLNSN